MTAYRKVRGHWTPRGGYLLRQLHAAIRERDDGRCWHAGADCDGMPNPQPLYLEPSKSDPADWVTTCMAHRPTPSANPTKVPGVDQPTTTPGVSTMAKLGQFDGKDVIRTTIAVTNAGDGLSNAMKVEPELFHLGEKVYVVLECEVANVKFVPLNDDDQLLNRVHTLRAGGAVVVDEALVADHLAAQAEKIRKAREKAEGYTEGNLVDAAEAAEAAAAEADPEHPGYGDAAGDDFDPPAGTVPAPTKEVEGETFVEDADGFAEPAGADKDATGLRGALLGATPGADNVVDIGSASASKKAPAKRSPRKAPAANKPPAKKAPARKAPASRKATK